MRVRAAISPHGGDGKSRTAPHFLNALRTSFSVLALLSLACLRRADCARACKTYSHPGQAPRRMKSIKWPMCITPRSKGEA